MCCFHDEDSVIRVMNKLFCFFLGTQCYAVYEKAGPFSRLRSFFGVFFVFFFFRRQLRAILENTVSVLSNFR